VSAAAFPHKRKAADAFLRIGGFDESRQSASTSKLAWSPPTNRIHTANRMA